MDERSVRLECLKLALMTRPSDPKDPLERAKAYEQYVIGHPGDAGPDDTRERPRAKPATKASTSPARPATSATPSRKEHSE